MKLKITFVSLAIFMLIILQILIADIYDIDTLKIEFAIIDLYCITVGIIIFRDLLHPYLVFIFLFNMFLGARIIIDLLGGDSFAYTTFFSLYKFPEIVQINILMMCILSLISFNVGVITTNYLVVNSERRLQRNDKTLKFSLICMIICAVPSVIYYYERMEAAVAYGYGTGNFIVAQAFESPLHYFANFLLLFYYLFLSSRPNKKEFYIVTVLQVLILIISLFGGERGTFALNIAVILVYHTMFIKKINWKKIMALGISMLFVFEIINDTRETTDYSGLNLSPSEMVREFFIHQGVSLTVLGYADQFKDDGSCLDVLYPFVNFLGDHLIDDYRTEYKPNIDFAHKISKEANSRLYYGGHGAGTSYIAELYSAGGYIGIIIGSIFIGLLMVIMKKYTNTLYGCFIYLIFLKSLFWMPRGPYFNWFTEGVRYMLYMYLVMIIFGEVDKMNIKFRK